MSAASYVGKSGSTGGVTGPHLHLGFIVDGKHMPLSQAGRSIAGTRIQFKRPGSETWESLFQNLGQSQYGLHPGVKLIDPFGVRAVHPVTGARNVPHRGEDYDLPANTMLRVLGEGSVTPLANVGAAGNMSRFTSRTLDNRPFTLEFMHLNELPQQASTARAEAGGTPPPAPVLPPDPRVEEARQQKFLKDYISNQMAQQILQQVRGKKQDPFAELQELMGSVPTGVLDNPLSGQLS
jgi:hypothetical protein